MQTYQSRESFIRLARLRRALIVALISALTPLALASSLYAQVPADPPAQETSSASGRTTDLFYFFAGPSYRSLRDGPFKGEHLSGGQFGFLFNFGVISFATQSSMHAFSAENQEGDEASVMQITPLRFSLLFSTPALPIFLGPAFALTYHSETLPQRFQFGEEIQLINDQVLEEDDLNTALSLEVFAVIDFDFPISIIPHFNYERSFGAFLFREESDQWQLSINLAL